MKSVLSIGCGRGTPEEGGIDPGVDVDEGRQRMEASVRSGCSRGCFRSFWGMERGTPEEGGIGSGVDAVEDVFEVFSIGCGRGTPEEGGIGPGRDSVGGYY